MTQMPFHTDAVGTGDGGPDDLHAAEAAGTVAGDSVSTSGMETGEASADGDVTIISAETVERAAANLKNQG